MLDDKVWASIAAPKEVLCIPCTERLLQRPLTVEDLSYCMANMPVFLFVERERCG